jgi:hypothetical protein
MESLMNKGKFKSLMLKALSSFISAILTVLLLENAGVENPLSIRDFSFSSFLLWVICFYTFEKLISKISVFISSILSNDATACN